VIILEKRNCNKQCDQNNVEFSCELDVNKKRRDQKNLDFSRELNTTDKKRQDKDCSNCVK
jgi:hypothetical protein